MIFLRFWRAILLVPALVVLMVVGCGESKPTGVAKSGGDAGQKSGDGGGSPKATSGEKTPLAVKETAALKGKVTYAGTPPPRETLKGLMEKLDDAKSREVCLSGDTQTQLWIVGPDGGVANVVVFLRAPDGKYFEVPEKDQKRLDAVMDQPHCAFIPHAVAFNPTVFDPAAKKQKKTGQEFKVLNSAPMSHNTAYKGNPLFNSGGNQSIPPKGELVVKAVPCKDNVAGGEDLLSINCDIHKWMTAKAAVFDHPYYAVTDNQGNYEIKDVPAGAEVIFAYWHESMDERSLKGAKTEKITLKPGETVTKDITINK
jgi:hypothetical protein